jgi:hypothetical protein
MSITTPDPRISTYNPVVATTDFPAVFPIFDNDDISVFVNGVERFDFSVSATYVQGIATDGKAVFAVGVTGLVEVVGKRAPHRTNRFVDGAPLPVRDQNLALDTLEAESQEARRDIDRSHKAPFGEDGGVFSAADIGAAQENAALAAAAAAAAAIAAAAAAAAAAGVNLPPVAVGNKGKGLTVNAAETGYELNLLPIVVLTRTAMKSLTTAISRPVYLMEAGRQGTFVLRTGSPPVTDAQEGIYVVSNTPNFYWERSYSAGSPPTVRAFGAAQDGTTDDTAAIQGALDVIGVAIIDASMGASVKVTQVRLKNSRNSLIGKGWPTVITGAVTPIFIENSFQYVGGFNISGAPMATASPAILIRSSLRPMTTITIENIYGTACGGGIMDENSATPANIVTFLNIRNITWAAHRGYGVATWDCWASYYIVNVVVDRVSMVGAAYNYPAFFFANAEGIFFINCAQNGSAFTSVQALQDGAVFDHCNFVYFENFIPDHSGGRGLVFATCSNVRGGNSTLVNCVDSGCVISGGSLFALSNVLSTQLAGTGLAGKSGFAIAGVTQFRATNIQAYGWTLNGFFADTSTRMNVSGDFNANANRGIVTTGPGSANMFHGCSTYQNTAGNYSLSAASDYIRDSIVHAGTVVDTAGPAAG